MATIGTLIVEIGANVDGLKKGLGSAQGAVAKTSQKLGGMGRVMKGAVVAGAAAAAAGTIALGGALISVGAASVDVAGQIAQGQRDIQAQLGETETRAEALGQVAVDVFKNNFAESIGDATAAVITARQQLGDLGDNELQAATENAFRLSDAFGVDVGESLSAVRTLMDEFGMSQQEAFDFLAKGFQSGLNASDDFLDTIGEYSNQFAQAGADAGQFFSLMQTGLKGGMLGTDRAADAFKEFSIRILDGSSTTADALAGLGIDADEFFGQISSGEMTSAQAFSTIVEKLGEIEDPMLRNQLGVALLGTQFEDLGADAATALSLTQTSLNDMAGATDALDKQYENLGSVFEGIKRRALVALAPIGEKLLDLANRAMPLVQAAFDWFETTLAPIIEMAADKLGVFIDGLVNGIGQGEGTLNQLLTALQPVGDFIITTLVPALMEFGAWFINEGLPVLMDFAQNVLGAVVIPGLMQLGQWIGQIAQVVLPILAKAIDWVRNNFQIVGPVIAAVGAAILILTNPIAAVIAAVGVLAAAWRNDWGGIRTFLTKVWEKHLSPIFNDVKTWLQKNIPIALEFLSNAWTNVLQPALKIVWAFIRDVLIPIFVFIVTNTFESVKSALKLLAAIWENVLKPALQAVWAFIQDFVIPVLSALAEVYLAAVSKAAEVLAGIWENVLKPAMKAVADFVEDKIVPVLESLASKIIGTIGPAMEWFSNSVVGPLRDAFSGLGDKIKSVVDWLKDLADRIKNIDLPDWMQPGSPMPLGLAFEHLAGAMREVAMVELPGLRRGLGGMAVAGVGGGGGGEVHYHYHLTVNSSAGVEPIVQDFEMMKALS